MAHPRDIKPDPYRAPTQDEIARARDMYAQGFTVSRILAATDMSLGTLYYWLDGGPHEAQGPALPPIARRKVVVGQRRRALKTDRVSLAARLWRTAERQVRDIELRLAAPARSSPERERDVRMLAMLTRTVRDLSAFDKPEPEPGKTSGTPAGPSGRSVEEIRASLARKLEAIIAERDEEETPVEPEPQAGAALRGLGHR